MGKVDELSSVVPAPGPHADVFADETSSVRLRLQGLLAAHRQKEAVSVILPSLPSLDLYREKLEGIWERRWLTNQGECHQELERRLTERLDVPDLCVVSSGTMALLMSLQVLGLRDCDIITTPFTFLATANVLHWVGARPVFCDVDPTTGVIDAAKIEALITPRTRAILGVHVYGYPCDVHAIEDIAERHGLAVIYDAAHAFGARYHDRSLTGYGDLSALSFHATKLFSTCEGGAVVCRTHDQAEQLRQLRNFGIVDEVRAVSPGINGKMSELHAAYGLLQLDMVDEEIAVRSRVATAYLEVLKDVPGIEPLLPSGEVTQNHAYFPVRVTPQYGVSRDRVQQLLSECNIGSRKYFHPLVSEHPWFTSVPTAARGASPHAERMAAEILCLPLYSSLDLKVVEAIGSLLRQVPGALEI